VHGHTRTDGPVVEVNKRGPAFMFSYARPSRSTSMGPVEKLLGDLNHELGYYVKGYTEALPGGFDQDMPLGVPWKRKLSRMLAESETLIPLISRPFLASEWCGKEWWVFSQRKVTVRPPLEPGDTAIVPVIWVPVAESEMHPLVRNLQYDNSTMPASYGRHGLLALSRGAAGRPGDYEAAVNRIAKRVGDLLMYATVETGRMVNLDTAPNAFQKVQPTWEGVRFWHGDHGDPDQV
jgi:hypothetical protein